MLFVTNRVLEQSHRSRRGRNVAFDLDDTNALQSVFYCRRKAEGDYLEIGGQSFLEELRNSAAEQILVYVHGFSNLPEPHIFPRAETLQRLCDAHRANMVEVVPVIWPCDNDKGIVKDYFDDQVAAAASGFAFARVLALLRDWQLKGSGGQPPCLKRVNVLAHSMGNRAFREAMRLWSQVLLRGDPPMIFRNAFLVAADIVNESLERTEPGHYLPISARNLITYFASDDRALQASKVGNTWNRIASRRLGHTGPENMNKVPRNVYAVDCDSYNTRYDPTLGHSYFTEDETGEPGRVFQHICQAIDTGRVPPLSGDAEDRISFL